MADVLPTRTVLVNAATRTKNLSVLSVQEGFQIQTIFWLVIQSESIWKSFLELTCHDEGQVCFGACPPPEEVCTMQCPRSAGKCELVCETPPPPDCCGHMECRCKDGYARYVDHTGSDHRTFHDDVCPVLLTKVRSRDPLLGNSKCLPVDECPQGQCGDHEHWNECGSSCNEDFCCPTMGHGGTTTTDHMGGGTTSATGTAMGVRSLRNAFNINRNWLGWILWGEWVLYGKMSIFEFG